MSGYKPASLRRKTTQSTETADLDHYDVLRRLSTPMNPGSRIVHTQGLKTTSIFARPQLAQEEAQRARPDIPQNNTFLKMPKTQQARPSFEIPKSRQTRERPLFETPKSQQTRERPLFETPKSQQQQNRTLLKMPSNQQTQSHPLLKMPKSQQTQGHSFLITPKSQRQEKQPVPTRRSTGGLQTTPAQDISPQQVVRKFKAKQVRKAWETFNNTLFDINNEGDVEKDPEMNDLMERIMDMNWRYLHQEGVAALMELAEEED